MLAVFGVGLVGVAVAGQEEVPTIESEAGSRPPASAAEGRPATTAAGREPGRRAVAVGGGTEDASPVGGLRLPDSRPVSLTVPSIDVGSRSLVSLGLQPDGAMEVPRDPDLAGWYQDGPTPGELGPAVVVGHVDSAEEGPAVFFRLAELRRGAEVLVERADGTTAVFRARRIVQYPKDDFPTLEVYGGTDRAELRLITCGGSLDADGHYRDNVVVYARLVEVRESRA